MENVVYLNGRYLPLEEASVSPLDRGFLMADGIYEVTSVIDGLLIDYAGHMARLKRSILEMSMQLPCQLEDLLNIHREILSSNRITEGGIYLQLTRGAPANRDFVWPDPQVVKPTLFIFGFAKKLVHTDSAVNGIRVKTVPDLRWKRRDIKTVQLLYSSQSKTAAYREGYDDVWMSEDGTITEGSSSNAYIVNDGKVITRPLSSDILHGITRSTLLRFASETGIKVEERPFTVQELYRSSEAFATSSTSLVQPVISVDSINIGTGVPGPITNRLRELYIEESLKRGI
ncbi:D-amino-acid transaminase [Brucella pseudogrignonensis]|uniref:D-amino-acid transaminase n=1 Tax=Brucella pseudogrignonensis TaxID=419475 RepID=UPI003D965785